LNFTKAIEAAGARTRYLLFTRKSYKRWRNFAVLTFLTGGAAGNFHTSLPSMPGTSGTTALHPAMPHFHADPHQEMAVGITVLAVVAIVMALGLLLAWFGATARLVMVEDMVYDREAVIEPAGRLMRLGNSYFAFTVAWGLSTLLGAGAIVGAGAMLFGSSITKAIESQNLGLILGALAGLAMVMLPVTIVIGTFGMVCDELVIPLMYRQDLKAIPALKLVWSTIQRNPAKWACFVLVHTLLSMGVGMVTMLVLCTVIFTCLFVLGIASVVPGMAIGMVAGAAAGIGVGGLIFTAGVVIAILPLLLCAYVPMLVFMRCFSIYCLQDFEPGFEMLPVSGRAVLDVGASAATTSIGVPATAPVEHDPSRDWAPVSSDW
jgi:hypothetical protein